LDAVFRVIVGNIYIREVDDRKRVQEKRNKKESESSLNPNNKSATAMSTKPWEALTASFLQTSDGKNIYKLPSNNQCE
jgi:hypothetical protein